MLYEVFMLTTITTNTAVLSAIAYIIFKIYRFKMEAEKFLNDHVDININQVKKRERLSSVVAGGFSKQYLGKELQMTEIEEMPPEQIEKLYCKYEARLGSTMTKTLGNSFINLYVLGVSRYFKIKDTPKLKQNLNDDPFLNNALNNACCELYYKYGMYLAPFTTLLTTAQSIDFSEEEEEQPPIEETKDST